MSNRLFDILSNIDLISNSSTENWNSLTFSGVLRDEVSINLFKELDYEVRNLNKNIIYFIDSEPHSQLAEFLEDLLVNSRWTININKSINLHLSKLNFFFFLNKFSEWAASLNPFDEKNPLNQFEKLNIVVKNLPTTTVGENFILQNKFTELLPSSITPTLPKHSDIIKYVHIRTQNKVVINPQNFIVTDGICDFYSQPFFKMSVITLAATLTSEILDDNKVILRGIRKIDLDLYTNTIPLNLSLIQSLSQTVQWVYEEKADLRLKLFLERITLDIDYSQSYTYELNLINTASLQQAKERYTFIMFERTDEYQKELRELLKDFRAISDLYATKTRTVVSNLLRDALAGFFLIGITLFSKIDSVAKIWDNAIYEYVFKIFSIYFIISIVYQTIVDFFDIKNTRDEFIYWKNPSRQYISQKEFNEHMDKTINKRRLVSYIAYSILIITYAAIAFLSWNFIDFTKKYISTP